MPQNKQYDRVKEITDQLEDGIAQLFESDQYRQWLTTMSRFHDYSLNNTILIAMQKPDATLVAGYTSWQKNFGRQVQQGEKAIRILAPTPYKQRVEVDRTDPNTGEILFNPDGTTQKDIQEILRPAFKVVSVFDVSQTDGRELPSLGVNELTGDVQQFEMFFEALKRTCPVPMDFEQITSGAKGYYHQTERRIAIQEGMSQVQTVKTAIHEMAHQKLHSIDPDSKTPVQDQGNSSRNSKEVEAESVAYTICQHYGIDTSDYSFAYIAGWSQGKETPELKASLNTIRKAASEMITEIDGHLQKLQMERSVSERQTEAAFRVGDHFLEIHEAADGSWDYTVFGHNYREVDGGQLGEPGVMDLQHAVKEVIDFYQLSDQPVTEMSRDTLAALTGLYDPTKSDAQLHFMGQAVEDGFDPREFWVGGKAMDLTAERLSAEQLADIKYQVMVDGIPRMLYSAEQWHEIEAGIAEKLDVSTYADPALTPEQMQEKREALKTPQAHPVSVKQAETQTGPYRYYSTQRPVDLGTYPKSAGNQVTEIHNYDQRQPVENGQLRAWGYVEYAQPLTQQQMDDYELKPVPAAEEKTKAPKRQTGRKKSVLADLHEKQEQIAGAAAPKKTPTKSKRKEME